MVDTCIVTWTARNFEFEVAAGTKLVFTPDERLARVGYEGVLYVPSRSVAVSDGTGSGSIALVPGHYVLDILTPGGSATANVAVPNAATAEIGSCIDQVLSTPVLSDFQVLAAAVNADRLAAESAAVAAAVTGQEIPFLMPPAGEYFQTTTGIGTAVIGNSLIGAADRMEIFPFLARRNLTVDRLAINVVAAVAGGLGRIVIYDADANGRPDALLLETADIDCSTIGVKEAINSFTFERGKTYWLGFRHNAIFQTNGWPSTGTPDISGGAAPSTGSRKVLRRSVAFATPAPAAWGYSSAEVFATGVATAIWLRLT